jgi:hypothetical protein
MRRIAWDRRLARDLTDRLLLSAAAVALVAVAIAATVRMDSTSTEILVKSSFVALTLASRLDRDVNFDLGDGASISAKGFQLQGLLPGCEDLRQSQSARFDGTLAVEHITGASKSDWQVRTVDSGTIEIGLRGEGSFDIDVGPGTSVLGDGGRRCKSSATLPGSVRLIGTSTSSVTLQLRLAERRVLLRDVLVSNVGFVEQDPDASQDRVPVFRSAIDNGSVQFADVHRVNSLDQAEVLAVDIIDMRADDLSVEKSDLVLRMSGKVRSVRIGPERTATNVQPSWLEYLTTRDQTRLAGVWTATLALLGVLWRVREWARKQ